MVIYFASERCFKVCGSIVCKDFDVFYEYGTDTVCIVLDIIQVLQCLHIKYSELWSSLECHSLELVRFKACLFFCCSENLRHQSRSVAVAIEHLHKQQSLDRQGGGKLGTFWGRLPGHLVYYSDLWISLLPSVRLQ